MSFKELEGSKNNLLIMHYACTLLTKDPVVVTSISIKEFNITQTHSIVDPDEKKVLQFLLDFLETKQNYKIVTWNQTKENYGPSHIISRCKNHGLNYNCINTKDFIDLDDLLTKEYGNPYIKNPHFSRNAKFIILAKKNNITINDAEEGLMEIIHFFNKDFQLIQNSVARKVGIFSSILQLQFNNKLKTNRWFRKTIKKKIRIGITIFSVITGIITIHQLILLYIPNS